MRGRRRFLKMGAGSVAAGVAASVGGLLPSVLQAKSSVALGTATVEVVSDGYMEFSIASVVSGNEDQATRLLAAHDQAVDVVRADCNLTLFRDADKLVVFDVGAGPAFLPDTGMLLESLEALQVDPADVTHVVFTHAHPDHLWGLNDDFDELVFANAEYLISRAERDFWLDPNTLKRMPENRQSFAVGAARYLALIEDRLTAFDYEQEILPGVFSIDSHGHTPGHTSFELRSGSESLVVLGDALTHPVLSFARPDLQTVNDQDKPAAARTRQRLLDRLVADQARFVGYHLPYPGVGVAERAGNAYRYAPAI